MCSLIVLYKCKIVTTAISHIYKCADMADRIVAPVSGFSPEEEGPTVLQKNPPTWCFVYETLLN